ncbi:MAG TPA: ROK family protein [Gaiellaceae bacterium]|jgi:glucokinase
MTIRGGVDLGGTKIQAIVIDDADKVLGQARRPTPHEGGPPDVAKAIVETLREAAAAGSVDPATLDGIGVGSPGEVDGGDGTVAHARNLPMWDEPFPLAPTLSEEFGTRVAIGNDVQVGIDGEFALGAGRPYASLLGVFWGTGVGGGIILGGKPWLGLGSAAEIGHMVVKINGARCPCGRRGCVEAYAGRAAMEGKARRLVEKGSKTDLFELMEKHGRDRLASGIWARALRRHDHMAVRLIDRAIEALGAGIASALNLLDVEAVVIGGGLGTRLGEPYVKRIERAVLPHLFASERPPKVHVAELGDLGGAIGASLLVKGAKPKSASARKTATPA